MLTGKVAPPDRQSQLALLWGYEAPWARVSPDIKIFRF